MASEPTIGLHHSGTTSPDSEHVQRRTGGLGQLALPAALRCRLFVIFGALAFIKLLLLIGLRKHLQETHWRFSGELDDFLGPFTFYALAGLMVYTLIQLGRQCQPVGIRAVRMANGLVLGGGGLLILLAFHEGNKNLLYPVMTGVLQLKDLGPYLSLNFFFRPPYLAVWVLAYAFAYYWLVCSRRVPQVLTLTAIFAGTYWMVCWPEFMARRSDLWVIFLFGLVSGFQLWAAKRAFHPAWLLEPVCWTLLVWGLFRSVLPEVGELPPFFMLLSGFLVVLFFAAVWLAKWSGILRPWVCVAPFFFVTVFLLASANYPQAENLNNILGFSAKFPHYFLGELLVSGILAMGAIIYYRLRPGGSWWWLDGVGLIVIMLAMVDLRLTQIMGVRLGWDVLAFGSDPKMMLRMAKPHLPLLLGALTVAGVMYLIAVRSAGWWLRRGESRSGDGAGQYRTCALVGCFTLLALLGPVITKPDNADGQSIFRLVQSSPLWQRAVAPAQPPEDFFRAAIELGMSDWSPPTKPKPERAQRDLNVLLIFQESTYNQHLSLFSGTNATQPRLSKYRDRMELFPNFFSSFAGSIHARFATFTGLYPILDFSRFTLNRVPVKSVFEVLGEQGYECSLFYSSYLDYTGFRDFLQNRQLTKIYDADTMPGAQGAERVSWGLKEESTAQAIRQQLKTYADSGQRFFMTYIPAAPHYPYDKIPKEFNKYKMEHYGDYSPLYFNELLYMDAIVASLVDELKATGLLEKTLVVITADHGEMLGQNDGPIGHGWRVTPQLANIPLIILDPERKEYQINPTIGSQVDLLPTLLDTLGLRTPVGELYQGRYLYASGLDENHRIYLSSNDEFAIIAAQEIRTGSRRDKSGEPADPAGRVRHISNLGSRTVFTETNTVGPARMKIQQFDDFQVGLLRNYAFYRDSLRNASSTSRLSTAR